MEIQYIINEINNLKQRTEEFKYKNNNKPEFVFKTLLNFFNNVLKNEQKYYLYWLVTKTENILNQVRYYKSIELIDFYLAEIYTNIEIEDPISSQITNVILKPCEAFYYYKSVNNYELAKKCILESLITISKLRDMGIFQMTGSIAEQYLNYVRILFKEGRITESLAEFKVLIQFLSTGKSTSTIFNLGNHVNLKEYGKTETIDTLNYIIDNAIAKTIKNKELNIEHFSLIFKDFDKLNFYFTDDYFLLLKKTINYLLNYNDKYFICFDADIIFSGLFKLPDSIQFIFLNNMSKHFNDKELTSIVENYINNNLIFGHKNSNDNSSKEIQNFNANIYK